MKYILHIIGGLTVGGAELMLKRLIESQLNDNRHHHAVISLTGIGRVGTQLQEIGVEVRALNLKSISGIPWVLWRLIRIIRTEQPDIVQTWLYHADLIGGVAARIAGNRHVMWGIHSTQPTGVTSRLTCYLQKLCAKLSHLIPKTIVCVASAAKSAHISAGYDASKFVVIHNGFDTTKLHRSESMRSERRLELGLMEHELLVGWVGRFNAAKDSENFLQAAGKVAEQLKNIRFLMIGRNVDKTNTRLTALITRAHLTDRIILLGERTDISDFYAAMDVFCLSSQVEAFPLVLGEAMCMGLACVATDVGDSRVLLGDTGLLVPRKDPDALATALLRTLTMPPASRASMGCAARARIESNFTLRATCAQYESEYIKLTSGRERQH